MSTRTPTDATLATRAFAKLARITARRTRVDAALQRAKDRHFAVMEELNGEEKEARDTMARFGVQVTDNGAAPADAG